MQARSLQLNTWIEIYIGYKFTLLSYSAQNYACTYILVTL